MNIKTKHHTKFFDFQMLSGKEKPFGREYTYLFKGTCYIHTRTTIWLSIIFAENSNVEAEMRILSVTRVVFRDFIFC